MASNKLANYITVNVECYKCTCAQVMVTYIWSGVIDPLGASRKSSRVVTKVFQRYATHTLPTLQGDSFLQGTPKLMSYFEVLPSGSNKLYSTCDAQTFLRTHLVPSREQRCDTTNI